MNIQKPSRKILKKNATQKPLVVFFVVQFGHIHRPDTISVEILVAMGTYGSFLFIGYLTHILGLKTFIFNGVFGVQRCLMTGSWKFMAYEIIPTFHWVVCIIPVDTLQTTRGPFSSLLIWTPVEAAPLTTVVFDLQNAESPVFVVKNERSPSSSWGRGTPSKWLNGVQMGVTNHGNP